MLDQLTSADFAPHLHDVFIVRLEGSEPVALELISVAAAHLEDESAAPQRRPFSLMFLGPTSRLYLQQHIYRLEHEKLGVLDLFLVPLGPQDGRMRYEAIFN